MRSTKHECERKVAPYLQDVLALGVTQVQQQGF